MEWIYLLIASLLEPVWAVPLKQSEGLTRLKPTLISAVAALAGYWFLALALRDLPAGTAYAIWVGIGAVAMTTVGVVLLGEPVTPGRIVSIGFIVAGVVGLRLTQSSASP